MIVWHVTTAKKFRRYLTHHRIEPPVRAWKYISDAQRFSCQTGRKIIVRLRFPDSAQQLAGHRGRPVVLHEPYFLDSM